MEVCRRGKLIQQRVFSIGFFFLAFLGEFKALLASELSESPILGIPWMNFGLIGVSTFQMI